MELATFALRPSIKFFLHKSNDDRTPLPNCLVLAQTSNALQVYWVGPLIGSAAAALMYECLFAANASPRRAAALFAGWPYREIGEEEIQPKSKAAQRSRQEREIVRRSRPEQQVSRRPEREQKVLRKSRQNHSGVARV
jgi:hypothetical protein